MPAPLVLTAALPDALQRALDRHRARVAPQAARHAPAHLTLFRHLPGPEAPRLVETLRAAIAGLAAPAARLLPPIRTDGRAQAPLHAPVHAPALDTLRDRLAESWHGLLMPGDAALPPLHLSLGPEPPAPPLDPGPWRLPGLLLWRYGEACWSPLVALGFRR